MHYEIQPNPKAETFTQTALLEQIAAYSPSYITIIVTADDLVDPGKPVTLENFGIPQHHLHLVDTVVYSRDGVMAEEVLYTRVR